MLREIGRRKSCRRLRINSFWEDIERDFAASLAAGVRVANVFGLGLRECLSGQLGPIAELRTFSEEKRSYSLLEVIMPNVLSVRARPFKRGRRTTATISPSDRKGRSPVPPPRPQPGKNGQNARQKPGRRDGLAEGGEGGGEVRRTFRFQENWDVPLD